MSGQPLLRLQGVGIFFRSRRYRIGAKKNWALRNVSFDVYHGETIGIVGHNGAGKSTLLKLLAGIYEPDEGAIVRTAHTASLLSLQIGFLPHLSGRENAVLGGMLLGMSRRDISSRMDEVISFSELGSKVDDPIYTYSAGMRARLGFGVAFTADPDILLIDEVLGVGDRDFRRKSAAVMREKVASEKTVVLASHGEQTIRSLCTRVVWIENGVCIQQGPTDEVMDLYIHNRQELSTDSE